MDMEYGKGVNAGPKWHGFMCVSPFGWESNDTWKKAAMLKHVWNLCTGELSLVQLGLDLFDQKKKRRSF